jgi:sugar (pentulose or hexulose) kinase
VTLVAGVDSSTKSTKVVIVDSDDGKIVASATSRHPTTAVIWLAESKRSNEISDIEQSIEVG